MRPAPGSLLPQTAPPRVALVHDWLTGMRGGEYVLEAIAELFPGAELFTLLHLPGTVRGPLASRTIHTSLLSRLPGVARYYRHCLPLLPALIEAFDLGDFELVISSSHCVAKGIRKAADAVHVSYVHSPMRYMWDRFEDYFGRERASWPVRLLARTLRPYLQHWDREVSCAGRVDQLLANSRFVAERIETAYGRPASVVHPFADSFRFAQPRQPGPEYLMVGAFAPNKRVDLAIQAFNALGLPLLIVGEGQEEQRLKKLAGPTVSFLGRRSNSEIADLYARSRAFIFPGVEDFGITPLEAMAAGLPVIAYAAGGALETVVDGETGLLFREQTPESLALSIRHMEAGTVCFRESALRARAAEFSRQQFQSRLFSKIQQAWRAAGKAETRLPLPDCISDAAELNRAAE
jgi:glycosyltransferase involved in cell wall biosynthesis